MTRAAWWWIFPLLVGLAATAGILAWGVWWPEGTRFYTFL